MVGKITVQFAGVASRMKLWRIHGDFTWKILENCLKEQYEWFVQEMVNEFLEESNDETLDEFIVKFIEEFLIDFLEEIPEQILR